MSTLSRQFTWFNHSETGFTGWIPTSAMGDELFRPGEGVMVAHDTLEHFLCDGSMEDECMAFGSLWYIRAEQGRIRNFETMNGYSHAHTFAADLSDMLRDNQYADLKAHPRLVRPSHNTNELYANRDEMRRNFLRMVEDDDSEMFDTALRGEEEVEDYRRYLDAWYDTAFDLMVVGYRKANRRWGGHGHNHSLRAWNPAAEACDLFWELVERIDRDHSSKEEYREGDTIDVHVNIRRHSFNIVEKRAYQ